MSILVQRKRDHKRQQKYRNHYNSPKQHPIGGPIYGLSQLLSFEPYLRYTVFGNDALFA